MEKKKINFLFMDVDGTLTDGKIYMGNNEELFKAFHVRDGYGIKSIVMTKGIIPVVITARNSRIVAKRCDELSIEEVHQGCIDKILKLKEILERYDSRPDAVAYIGDDIADLECMRFVKENGGITGCPNDAVLEVKNMVDFIAPNKGGEGAVRDFIQWLMA